MGLIAIGIWEPSLLEEVYTVADRIGKVEVDHCETSSKTSGALF